MYLHCIGNLSLLSPRKNIVASNSNFCSKKEVYTQLDGKVTAFALTRELCDIPEWTAGEVETRQIRLSLKLKDILQIR